MRKTMACELTKTGRVLFVLWGRPGISDIPLIIDAADDVIAKTGGPLIIIARVPPDTPPPDRIVQDAIKKRMGRLLEHCAAFHILMEGDGFPNVIKRSVLSGIFLGSGRRKTFFVHSTIEGLRKHVARDVSKHAVEAGLLAAERHGMLTRTLDAENAMPAAPAPPHPSERRRHTP
jgi:hypothetical protein